jgi:SnoaL-like protein
VASHLPRPIEIFFESDTGREADACATCFAADATVQDEGRTHEGLAAITAWKIEARRTYQYTAEPLEASPRDGQTVVTAGVSGTFAGSPVTLTFIFGLEGEKIASLETRP